MIDPFFILITTAKLGKNHSKNALNSLKLKLKTVQIFSWIFFQNLPWSIITLDIRARTEWPALSTDGHHTQVAAGIKSPPEWLGLDKIYVQNIHHCSTTLRQTKTKTSSISFAKIELNSSSLCINYYWHEADCLVEVYQRCSQKPALSSARLEIENYTDDPQKCLPNILKEINDYSSSNSTYHFDTRHDFLHINKVWVSELDVLKGDHVITPPSC